MVSGYSVLCEKSEKTISYKTPRGKEVCFTREVYLRDDVPCRSLLCSRTECHEGGHCLPSDLKLYILVDGFYALYYWELFELEDIKGVIISLSSLNFVQQQASTKRPYRRIRSSLEDASQTCILFDNEFSRLCFHPPFASENLKDYTTRLVEFTKL